MFRFLILSPLHFFQTLTSSLCVIFSPHSSKSCNCHLQPGMCQYSVSVAVRTIPWGDRKTLNNVRNKTTVGASQFSHYIWGTSLSAAAEFYFAERWQVNADKYRQSRWYQSAAAKKFQPREAQRIASSYVAAETCDAKVVWFLTLFCQHRHLHRWSGAIPRL